MAAGDTKLPGAYLGFERNSHKKGCLFLGRLAEFEYVDFLIEIVFKVLARLCSTGLRFLKIAYGCGGVWLRIFFVVG